MATGTWTSKSSNYGKGTNAWSGNQGTLYLGNSYCARILLSSMSAVSIASVLNLTIERTGNTGSFPIWFYVGNDANVLPGNITTSCTLLTSGTLTVNNGIKTYSLVGHESKLNVFTGDFYLYIVSDGTQTSNTVSITGGTTYSGTPAITATYESSAVNINVSGSWKKGIPYVNVGGSWKPGVIYTNVGGSWKVGT